MLSENRLEKRTIGVSSQTTKDYQDTSSNDTLYNTIAIGLSIALGHKLYKSGALKEIAKPMLEIADKIAKEGTDKASVTMSTIKEWANMKHLNTTQLKFANQRWSAAKNSIFRRRDTSFAYDLFEDLKDISSGNMRFKNMRNLIQGTTEDINVLQDMIKTRQKELPAKRKNTINTDLYDKLKNLDNFITTITHEDDDKIARAYRRKYMQELVETMTLTPEQAAQELRESGYKKATLKDFGKVIHEDGIDKFVINPDAKFDLDYSMNDKGESLVDRINKVLRNNDNKYIGSDGKSTSLAKNDWQDLIIDSAIRVDSAGNVIDYRMTKEAIIGFKRSVANDFRLPVVQFNPFKSLRGWDKAGRKIPMAGYLFHNQYMPSITGMGGREMTIGQWLAKNLGEEYVNSNVAVINGKAYVKNLTSQTDELIEVANNLRLHNITYADGAYGLKPGVNAERQIANLDLGHPNMNLEDAFNETWDKYAERLEKEYDITPTQFQKAKYKFGQMLDIGFTESRPDKEAEALGLDTASSVDEWTNKLLETLFGSKPLRTTGFEYDTIQQMAEETRKFTYKNIWFDGDAPKEFATSNGKKFRPNIYVAQKEGYNFNNVVNAIKSGDNDAIKDATKRFVYQFGPLTGRNPITNEMSEYYTRYSTGLWIILNQLSEGLGVLGLSTASKSSSGAILFNLLAKKALPVYAALQIPGMINYFSEPIFGKDEDGNPDNLGKFIMRGVSKFDIGAHHVMDLVGATKFFKFMGEMTPGSDQINELPGIYQLGLGQTAEEREDYIENGYDPIRKGRWWGAGNCVIPTQNIQVGYGITKQAQNIQVGNTVITHEGILKPVLNIITRNMHIGEWCPEIQLHTDIFTNITTDNHPYLCIKKKECPSSSNVDCRPDRVSKLCDKCIYNVCSDKNIWIPQWVLARDLKEGDYLAYPRIKILNKNNTINGLPANYEIGYLLGAFLAEGNIHRWVNGIPRGIELTVGLYENIFIDNIMNILKKYFPGNTTGKNLKQKDKSFIIRNLSCKVSKWFFDILYESNHNKHFVPDIYSYNEEFIKGILTGLFDGDGHIQISKNSNTLSIWYTSARLEYAIQVRNLLFTFGIQNSITHHGENAYRIYITGNAAIRLNNILHLYKTQNISFNVYNKADKYQIIDDNFVYIKIKSIKDSGYFGTVYDYEIQDSHSFCSLSTVMHNTPFTGGKIMYFRPNIYRRVQADVDFSDSKWGSRQEYYNNTWYPNPINPFAPINHFITNRNYYDKKHYYDRPYLETSPEGSNIPIVGPLFSSTIGKIINPPQKMHMEYWVNGFQPASEEPNSLLTEGTLTSSRPAYSNSEYDINTFQGIETKAANAAATDSQSLYTSAYHAKQMTSRTITDNAGITFQERSILPERTYDRYPGNPYEVYSTPSGNLTVVDVPDELNLYNVNQDLQRWSINKVIGTNQRVNLIDSFQGPGVPVGNDSPSVDNAFLYGLGENYEWLGDVAGLKGFAFQQFVTGHANEKARVIENSGYAYSTNNDFWEANLGGLGGNLSEITRRFIPERNKNTEYINPIRNTMPNWMPGSNYFTDFKHGDPYSKVPNGEERLPGEGYERLHNINMNLNIGSSFIGYSRADIVKHLLGQDGYMSSFTEDTLNKGTKVHKQIEQEWKDAGFAIDTEGEIKDSRNGIIGYYDAMIKDPTSKTGIGIVDIKTTSAKKLEEIRKSGKPLEHHQKQVNYYLWGTKNTESNGYIYYVDKENLNNSYMVGFKYSEDLLKDTLNNLYGARQDIKTGLATGQIGRGELYSVLDKFRVLADVAPYSQEYRDMSAQLANENLTPEEQEEASRIRERVTQQKEPLRVYDYKFKTSNLKYETVTVANIVNNNTIITKEYGKEHSIKFAGMNVSESNSEYYETWDEEYTDKKGRKRTRKTGITMNDAARKEIKKYIRPGSKIVIGYDADEHNKYTKDSTRSIRAVIKTPGGTNINQRLLNKGLAKEKEEDDSPAAINARYTKGEIAFGSAMERLTHSIATIPFVGSKLMQVRSPYEQYRKREVYGKDFQSWNNPIRDMLIPSIQENIADNRFAGLGGIITGAFVGSLFGKGPFGKIVGTVLGASVPAVGKLLVSPQYNQDRDWRPKRRREQEELNEYVDTLKYVKNMSLYNKYKTKALKEDHFDVDKFMESKEAQGVSNKLKQQELTDYKRKVKLDFKHRDRYNFKYGEPKYVEKGMDYKSTISAINKEIAEIQGQRKVTKVPKNALLAIDFKQRAEKTMYGYEPGDSLVDIMSALPKKERQYFKHFMDTPEEEKEKILRIAPSYLRRALQSTWGMPVDKKPSLNEYFQTHGLPDSSWIGWDENTNIDDVKVKLVHQNNLDPGEFDIWDDNERQADATNIPIPMIHARNNARQVQMKLNNILGHAGYQDIQMSFVSSNDNKTSLNIKRDARPDVENQIQNLEI